MNFCQYAGQVLVDLLVSESKHHITGIFDCALSPKVFLLLCGMNSAINLNDQTRIITKEICHK